MKFPFIIHSIVFRTSKCNVVAHDKLFRYFSFKTCNSKIPQQLPEHLDTMPKPTTHTVTLKKHRLKLKEKGQKYIPGTVSLQVLGSGANGSPRSLYVFTDQSRYLFNCGEGTQRLAHEHKMKLSKLEHIFVTHPTWDNIGGLPGVSLTIQDVGVPQITIHGPPGTDEIFIATRRFVVLRYLAIKMAACDRDAAFEDNVMKVWYAPLCTPAGKEWFAKPPALRSPPRSPDRVLNADDSTDDDIDYYAYWHNGSRSTSPTGSAGSSPNRNKKRRHLSPDGKASADLPPAGSVSMAYVCRLHDRPGSLSLPACVSRGVPPGPLLGQLKAGLDVTLPNGNVVRSTDVTSPDEPGPVFIVVECPSEQFLDSLEEEEVFKRHQSAANNDIDVAFLVVHFSPPHVMDHPRYRRWMGLFPASTHHLVLNTSNRCMGSVAVHRIQHKLHMLCPRVFPLLADDGIPSSDAQQQQAVEENGDNDEDKLAKWFAVVPGHTFTNINLRPQKLVDSSRKLVLEPEVWRQETMVVEGFPAALEELRAQLPGVNGRGYPRVVFLGTGSCIPNKTRNTSGILVHLSETSCVVLDCGEATYGQLVRLYGVRRTADLLRGLSAIYVSHLHADHHIGLMGLLRARRAVTDRPLALLAPRQIRNWLETYHSRFEPVLDNVKLVPNQQLVYTDVTADQAQLSALLEGTGLARVTTCVVRHCPNAFAVCLAHTDGWRITYSGDTMPCDDLVQLGKGCDLLIHEATMEDKLEGEARLKMHSTTSQALDIGRQMGARFTLLTHFSQRYAKVPIFNQNFSDRVGIAFDNMEVSLEDLPTLPLLYPSLRLMFAEHYEEMELKSLKRQLQQERETARLAT